MIELFWSTSSTARDRSNDMPTTSPGIDAGVFSSSSRTDPGFLTLRKSWQACRTTAPTASANHLRCVVVFIVWLSRRRSEPRVQRDGERAQRRKLVVLTARESVVRKVGGFGIEARIVGRREQVASGDRHARRPRPPQQAGWE